jgi:uncharacterized membrane protein YkoI
MNTTKLRSKRILVPTLAAVAAFGVGGVVWATTANADLAGSERDRVGAAATEAAGGGTVVDAETSDDLGQAYEVEVRMDDGTEVEVDLDDELNVVSQRVDGRDDLDDDDERDDDRDADDRVLRASERSSAEEAALAAVEGGGTVTDIDASDDPGVAYEVEVHAEDHTEWQVELDAEFQVLRKILDD